MSTEQFSPLESELRAMAPVVAFPPTPDLASLALARIGTERSAAPRAGSVPTRRRTSGWGWRPAFAVALVAAIFLAASPGAREAVASVFRGVPGIRLIFGKGTVPVTPVTPVTQPTPSPTSAPPSSAAALPSPVAPAPLSSSSAPASASPAPDVTAFGTPTTPTAAASAVSFRLAMPTALGRPAAVFLDRRVEGGMVTMRWPAGPGLPDAGGGFGVLLTQFHTSDDFPYFLKEISGRTHVDWLEIDGAQGGWVTGGHPVAFSVPGTDGTPQPVSSRLAANTLIWIRNGVTFRLETAAPLARALEIAHSLR